MCKESVSATETACSPYNEKLGTLLRMERILIRVGRLRNLQ
jgi:hypothetical protein